MRRAKDINFTWERLSLIGFLLNCLIISNKTVAKIMAFKLPGISFQFIVPAGVIA